MNLITKISLNNFVPDIKILMKKLFSTITILLAIAMNAHAQKLALSTNAFDWGMLGTANIEAQVSAAQHISVIAGARYNPWQFETPNPHLIVQNPTRHSTPECASGPGMYFPDGGSKSRDSMEASAGAVYGGRLCK